MKFVTYAINTSHHIGVWCETCEKIIDVNQLLDTSFTDMNHLIDTLSPSELELIASKIKKCGDIPLINPADVTLCAPIPYPKRPLFCLGKNYLDHALETQGLPGADDDIPKHPIFFMKMADPATGHGAQIPNHADITQMIDYEVELALVIGKEGINITKDQAYDHIFGYTIANDVSARNLQRKHSQLFKGKSLEGFSPMGPALVHKSAFTHPLNLHITCSVNGELRQDSNTSQLIFDIPTIIEDLSKGMRLKKGDIILTGTPAGVGLGFKPYKFLKSGDVVRCHIEGIGVLENVVE